MSAEPVALAIRPGRPDEARAIWELKRECFGGGYLDFSAYQSPKSATHLRALLENRAGSEQIAVATKGDWLVGYWQAARTGDAFHLNYIGTAPAARSRGLGSTLLAHFERAACEMDISRLTLDAFASNGDTAAWYARCGYREVRRSMSTIVDLSATPPGEAGAVDPDELRRALQREDEVGFSLVRMRLAGFETRVGLIAGCVLRLIDSAGLEPERAAAALARALPRPRLILAGLESAPELPLLRVETSIRMEKAV